jgi:hypothetical protein
MTLAENLKNENKEENLTSYLVLTAAYELSAL